MGPCVVDLDEYVEGLNENLQSSEQVPTSNEFLDAVYNQILELPDTASTPEEVDIILHNTIKKLI